MAHIPFIENFGGACMRSHSHMHHCPLLGSCQWQPWGLPFACAMHWVKAIMSVAKLDGAWQLLPSNKAGEYGGALNTKTYIYLSLILHKSCLLIHSRDETHPKRWLMFLHKPITAKISYKESESTNLSRGNLQKIVNGQRIRNRIIQSQHITCKESESVNLSSKILYLRLLRV